VAVDDTAVSPLPAEYADETGGWNEGDAADDTAAAVGVLAVVLLLYEDALGAAALLLAVEDWNDEDTDAVAGEDAAAWLLPALPACGDD
jgi:hypothetical protein